MRIIAIATLAALLALTISSLTGIREAQAQASSQRVIGYSTMGAMGWPEALVQRSDGSLRVCISQNFQGWTCQDMPALPN